MEKYRKRDVEIEKERVIEKYGKRDIDRERGRNRVRE